MHTIFPSDLWFYSWIRNRQKIPKNCQSLDVSVQEMPNVYFLFFRFCFFSFFFFSLWVCQKNHATHHQSTKSTLELMRYAKNRVDFISKERAKNWMLNSIHLVSLLVGWSFACLLASSVPHDTVVWFCMNSRESRWPFLYLSAGTRTHYAIRQSTVRELAFTYGFIKSNADDRARMCYVW